MKIEHILETCLYVDDLVRAEQFYRDVLGLTFVSRQEGRQVFFRCGERMLLLFNPLVSRESDGQFPPHGSFGSGHVAFAAALDELPQWREWFEQRGVVVEKTIDWPGGGQSLYFRDTAGNLLELATPRIWGLSEPKG